MSENISDRNGRALEYKVSLALASIPNFSLTKQALTYNQRDAPKFKELPSSLKRAYACASLKIATWVKKQIQGTVSIDRLGDDANEVADIKLLSSQKTELNLSLKHNHHALKHPRPYSFAQACGYIKGTTEDMFHRGLMENVGASFRAQAANKTLFRDCEESTIDSLYLGVCNACETSLNSWIQNDINVANNLFGFLVNTGFYKVIVETESSLIVKIQDYSNILPPTAVTANVTDNRLILTFNNGWVINNRIHTASKSINAAGNQLSLKFDAQRTHGTVFETII